MSFSGNGWPVIPTATDERLAVIPKVAGRVLKGDVEFLFRDLVSQFDKYVEDIDVGRDDWGYSNRPRTGGTDPSTHASGTALDLNAMLHPMGRKGTFTAIQVKGIEKILKRYSGCIMWGGSWLRPDDMHFEISGTASEVKAAVANLKKIIAAEAVPPKPDNYDANIRIQRALRKLNLYSGAVDGIEGKMQIAAVKKYQANQKAPFKLYADGIWGAETEKHYQWVLILQDAMNNFGKISKSLLLVDGDFGTVTVYKVKSIQTLYKGTLYRGAIDSDPGPMFCKMIGIPAHP